MYWSWPVAIYCIIRRLEGADVDRVRTALYHGSSMYHAGNANLPVVVTLAAMRDKCMYPN
jgi:hypothetical protein